jgi:hypothetical protein
MDDLAVEIASQLEAMMLHQTHYLIIERVGHPYYVQFIASRDGDLRCEAVSNTFLVGDDRLHGEAELRLIGLGWASADPLGDPNFKQLWEEPIPFVEVGGRMARTLVEVYGACGLDDVTFTFGRRADDQP